MTGVPNPHRHRPRTVAKAALLAALATIAALAASWAGAPRLAAGEVPRDKNGCGTAAMAAAGVGEPAGQADPAERAAADLARAALRRRRYVKPAQAEGRSIHRAAAWPLVLVERCHDASAGARTGSVARLVAARVHA